MRVLYEVGRQAFFGRIYEANHYSPIEVASATTTDKLVIGKNFLLRATELGGRQIAILLFQNSRCALMTEPSETKKMSEGDH